MTEENNKKEKCPLCRVSEETISQLKNQGKKISFEKGRKREKAIFDEKTEKNKNDN